MMLLKRWSRLWKSRNGQEVSEELSFHLEKQIEANLAAGMSPDEARRQALISFGGVQQTRERVGEARWTHFLETLLQDARYAFRVLRKSPGFVIIAVLTLALGIGANTAVFSTADALLLRPLPFPDLDRLVTVFVQYPNGGLGRRISPADFRDYRQQSRSFDHLSAYASSDFNITGESMPERVTGARVSADFFNTIGVSAITGRTFAANEELSGAANVAVLSYGLWLRRFGGDAKVIGESIQLNGSPFTVIGVMDRKVTFPGGAELWVPLEWTDKVAADRKAERLEVVGLLKPGATMQQAEVEMKGEAQRLAADYPITDKGQSVHLEPLRLVVNGTLMVPTVEALFISVLLVLLLACANVGNLQLARSAVRAREMSVRAALGARRGRLLQQLLLENCVLAVMGSIAAFVLARWMIALQVSSTPPQVLRLVAGMSDMQVDNRAFLFMLVVAVFSVLASGLLPALAGSRPELTQGLKDGAQSSAGRSQHRLRNFLVGAQIAFAMALLAGTILTARGFQAMAASSRSFAPEHVLTFSVTLPASRYGSAQQKTELYEQAIEKLGAMPGVQSAALFTTTPLSNNGVVWTRFRTEQLADAQPDHLPGGIIQSVSADYFDTLHIPLLRGRRFTSADRAGAPEVVIISERLARRFFPKGDAIGKRLKLEDPRNSSGWMEVVGISGDVLYDWTNQVPEPAVYRPFSQAPMAGTLFAVRTSADPLSVTADARRSMARLDGDLPIYNAETLAQAIDEGVSPLKVTGYFIAALGLVALLLAAVGVYGLMACSVAERRKEIGIRMALGAGNHNVVRIVLRRGLVLTAIGIGAGLPLAFALGKALASVSYGVQAAEATLFISCAAILSVIALLACAVPARRATQVSPMVALRNE